MTNEELEATMMAMLRYSRVIERLRAILPVMTAMVESVTELAAVDASLGPETVDILRGLGMATEGLARLEAQASAAFAAL